MSRKWIRMLTILLTVIGLAIVWSTTFRQAGARSSATPTPTTLARGSETPRQESRREADAPTISFIDSPSPTCYRPVAGRDACYIQWNYLYVYATAPEYVISMTVAIDGRLRAYHSAFFQTAMYIPGETYQSGFRVACGVPGAGGEVGMGNTHSYTIRARETGGLGAANYGSVTCPAVPKVFLPLLRK
jgi:hypothetical protein